MAQREVDWFYEQIDDIIPDSLRERIILFKEQAKEMEKQQNEKFNEFLDDEKVLGISDLKTIERIQWYYNNYFNENYKKD